MEGIYLDYNSTTPTDPEVVAAMEPFFTDDFANPSNLHSFGLRANRPVTAARRRVVELLGAASPEEIVFTAGGSEDADTADGTLYITDRNDHRVRRVGTDGIVLPSGWRAGP